MAESKPADVHTTTEVDAIADELYGLPPDEFTPARDEHVRKARADKHAELAREIGKLRKPTQSAWLINLLWRDQREVLEQFFDVAVMLRQAQADAAGVELRALTTQRRQLENAMIRQAKALAQQAGVDVGPATEREAQETLSAALAEPEVADEVRTGRLVKAVAYAGFGSLATSPRPSSPPARTDAAEATPAAAQVDDFAAKAAERARQRRAEAERRVAGARADLERMADAFAEADRSVSSARKKHRDLVDELEQTESRLRELKVQAAAADQAAQAAGRRRDQAEKDRELAERALEHAQQALRELPAS